MQKKSLFVAWILNIIPGIGLLYVGKTVPGVILIVIAGIFLLICLTGIGVIVGLPLYLLTSLIACIASVVAASNYNKSLSSQ